ncbi:MAG TPA: DNA translocase FtsK 4TM domain-containing protein, partial [Pseudomonadales bacterium]|nr:DNA translocase FtsK 4TM domain-containing protein [Pseudomonadales bacterium]
MNKATRKNLTANKGKKSQMAEKPEWLDFLSKALMEGLMLMLIALSAVLFFALISYDRLDPGWSYVGPRSETLNLIGPVGAWSADVLYQLFGYMALLFPFLVAYRAWRVFRDQLANVPWSWPMFSVRAVGVLLTLIAGAALAALYIHNPAPYMPASAGGALGLELAKVLAVQAHVLGASILLLVLFALGLIMATDFSLLYFFQLIGKTTLSLWSRLLTWFDGSYENWSAGRRRDDFPVFEGVAGDGRDLLNMGQDRVAEPLVVETKQQRFENVQVEAPPAKKENLLEKSRKAVAASKSTRVERKQQSRAPLESDSGTVPPLSLLDKKNASVQQGFSRGHLDDLGALLIEKLKDFGVIAEVRDIIAGPVVTRFEIQPAPGIKASRITGLARDLARSLAVVSVRVVEVIAGKTFVGIEIPNPKRDMITLHEVLASTVFEEARSPLTIGLGKDISGQAVVADVAKMPHLLVAGTTGSGKSVGLNAMIISLLLKASPKDVRLIMIDPKMLELSVYDDIPHLLCPVVTDMKEAANALRWCVAEMERRYQLMAALGVRNIGGFNHKLDMAREEGLSIEDPLFIPSELQLTDTPQPVPTLENLPFIVVVIDEFADMIMVVGKKVEELIARIAQKARAAGIHLILATQRPSVDVITGLIKA